MVVSAPASCIGAVLQGLLVPPGGDHFAHWRRRKISALVPVALRTTRIEAGDIVIIPTAIPAT
jgi:hypothetical protein